MPSSICWPLLSPHHFCADAIFALAKTSAISLAAEQAALVHPGAEVGRDGDVGRGGDDAVGERRRRPCDRSSRMRPNAAWVDCSSPAGAGMCGNGDRAEARGCASRARSGCARSAPRRPAAHCRRRLRAAPIPGLRATPIASRSAAIWVGFIRPGMIVLVAGEGQAEALDRPGDEQGRDIVLRGVERLDQRLHAMAAKVGEQRRQRRRRHAP